MPERSHPFPSRTRKLSSPGPMVLQGQLCGRVGRCRGFEGLRFARVSALHLFSAPQNLPPLAHRCAAAPAHDSADDRQACCQPSRLALPRFMTAGHGCQVASRQSPVGLTTAVRSQSPIRLATVANRNCNVAFLRPLPLLGGCCC